MVATDIRTQPEGAGRRASDSRRVPARAGGRAWVRAGRAAAVSGLVTAAVLASAGCPTVDLGDDPVEPGVCRPSPDYFRTRIWPEYLAQPEMAKSCVGRAGCHGETDGRSALRLDVSEPIDFTRNYQVVTRFLNCGTPEASSLFTKPLTGEDPHGGGDMFTAADPSVAVFEGWF
ncbi:MAG: hypothetical protein IPL61_10460 [Myxococcales bacterium]|nr:hypothetical protein [Myxococcales bacterium]